MSADVLLEHVAVDTLTTYRNVKHPDYNAVGNAVADDSAAIAAAIAASSPGDTVTLPPSTGYFLGSTTVEVDKAITLRIEAPVTGSGNPIFLLSAEGARLEGVNFPTITQTGASTNNDVVIQASNTSVNGIQVESAGMTHDGFNTNQGNSIMVEGTALAPVEEVSVTACFLRGGHHGVMSFYMDDSIVSHTIFDFDHEALAMVELDRSNSNIVSNNVMKASGGSSGAVNAVYILSRTDTSYPADHNVIIGNSINGDITIEAILCFTSHNTIANNTIALTGAGTGTMGVSLPQQNTGHASKGHHNSVIGNTIHIAGGGGAGCRAIATGSGNKTPAVHDIVIANNTILFEATAQHAVILNNATDVIFANNAITMTAGVNALLGTGSDIRIFGNNIDATGTGNALNIMMTRASIRGNLIKNSAGHGILLQTGASGCDVTGNWLIGNGGYGVRVLATAAADNAVYDNKYLNNTSGTYLFDTTVHSMVLQESLTAKKILAGDGSTSSPGLSFENSPGSGFYKAGVDNIVGVAGGYTMLQMSASVSGLLYRNTSRIKCDSTGIGFNAAPPIAKPTVSGSRGGNAALASLLTALANYGLITDSST